MNAEHKILVVDDNLVNCEILEELLADEFLVRIAGSSGEALQIAQDFRPKVILLDVMLPDLDGYQTCTILRKIPLLQSIKIIMVSAKALPSERQAGLAAGADDYITKPFDEVVVMKMVRDHFGCDTEHLETTGG